MAACSSGTSVGGIRRQLSEPWRRPQVAMVIVCSPQNERTEAIPVRPRRPVVFRRFIPCQRFGNVRSQGNAELAAPITDQLADSFEVGYGIVGHAHRGHVIVDPLLYWGV